MAVKLTSQRRQEIISDLVENCDCWKHEGDGELLNSFADSRLVALQGDMHKHLKAIEVANTAVEGFVDTKTGKALRINPESGKWEPGKVEKQTNNSPYAGKKGSKPVMEDPEEDDGEDDEVTDSDETPEPVKTNKASSSDKSEKVETPRTRNKDYWYRNAPLEVQETLRNAREIENREKESIINKLLANVGAEDQQLQRDRLFKRSLSDLYDDLALIPQVVENKTEEKKAHKTVRRRETNPDESDMLMTPVINWREEKEPTKPTRNSTEYYEEDLETSDDEIIKQLPASLRNRLVKATEIENRERRKLIDEIIDRSDLPEEDEKRLMNRLQSKPLDELRDNLLMLGNRERETDVRPSYFSASAPVGNRGIGSGSTEDVLPLPSMTFDNPFESKRKQA